MKKISLLLLTILTSLNSSFACLQRPGVSFEGKIIGSTEAMIPHDRKYHDHKKYLERDLHKYDSLWKATKNIDQYSGYGVTLVELGQYEKALVVFKDIEKMQPGLYATAANMGTVYELLGRNNEAHQWISKAIKINPEAHGGSEWLHLKILEAKIKGKKYITSTFLIGTDFGNDSIPVSELSDVQLDSLMYAVYYQLDERISFIQPKDEIMALLLFEYGNICALRIDPTAAIEIYEMAEKYGYSGQLFNKRFALVKRLNAKLPSNKRTNVLNKIKIEPSSYRTYIIGAITIFLLVIAAIIILIKRRKNNKLNQQR